MSKKNSGGMKSAIIIVIIPLLIIVMVASIFYAIINGIIEIITQIVTAIVNFFKDPIGTIVMMKATIVNAVASFFGWETFDGGQYNQYGLEPRIFISEEQYNQMVDRLDISINRDAIGLDELMMKKMLLIYYRSMYTSKTQVLIQLSEDAKGNLPNPIELAPFKTTEEEDPDTKEKHTYLYIYGATHIKSGQIEMDCYEREGLELMYETYLANKDKNTADAVKNYLKHAYTVSGNTITMVAFDETEIIDEYSGGVEIKSKTKTVAETPNFQTLDYSINISKYATPVEFMTTLMQISGSKEFVETFIKMAYEKITIDLDIKDIERVTETKTESTYDLKSKAEGKIPGGSMYSAEALNNGDILNEYLKIEAIDSGYEADSDANMYYLKAYLDINKMSEDWHQTITEVRDFLSDLTPIKIKILKNGEDFKDSYGTKIYFEEELDDNFEYTTRLCSSLLRKRPTSFNRIRV